MTMIGSALQRLATPLRTRPAFALRRKRLASLLASTTRNDPGPADKPLRYRTVFISDTHLGTRGCKAEHLANFLRRAECETLYLVGDIVDGWRLRRSWYWPAAHNDVVQEILRKAREGVRVIYIPGNHDESLRDYTGLNFGGVDLVFDSIHETADGRRFLVIHGDHFDGVVMHARWLAVMGDWAYALALVISDGLSWIRRKLGLSYWSLSGYLKYKVKNAVEYISNYEQALVREAKHRKVDGVICGHIHHAEISTMEGVLYCNDGDWVESCTALVEDYAGALSILEWHELEKEAAAQGALAHSA